LPASRVTVAELAQIDATAAAYGLDTSEFIRRRSLGVPLPEARAISDDRLIFEINRIGNNLNQIAKAGHLGKPLEGMLSATLTELRDTMAKVARDGS